MPGQVTTGAPASPVRLVFCIRKTQVSWLIVKIVTGQKGQQIGSCGPRVAAGVSTGRRKALLLLPLHTFHPHVTGLPGFRIWAPIFSVGKIGENTFFI